MEELIEFIFEYSWVWMMFIIIYKTHKWYSKSDKTEELLILKLIGYYILGGFSFNINGIMPFSIIIPIGILVYVLTIQDKEKRNKDTKDKIARFAFLMLCIGTLCSFINYYLEYRVVYMKDRDIKIENLYNDYFNIKQKMDIEENLFVNYFRVEVDENNEIKEVIYILEGANKNYLVSYENTNKKDGVIRIEPSKSIKSIDDKHIKYNTSYRIMPEELIPYVEGISYRYKDKKISDYTIGYDLDFNYIRKNQEETNIYYIDKDDKLTYRIITSDMMPIEGIMIRGLYSIYDQDINELKDIYVINPTLK